MFLTKAWPQYQGDLWVHRGVEFEHLVPKLDGYGGALGISAFLSVCACHIFILFGAPRSKKR